MVVKLLNSYRLKLIDLTQNFSKIPTKSKEMLEFFKIFKAGNPLMDENIRESPGIVDLCYCGINQPDEKYSVFRRNKRHYTQGKRKQK
jgi:hypothetical protein